MIISLSTFVNGLNRNELPGRLQKLHEDQCETIVRTDCLTRRKLRQKPGRFICAQLTEKQLLKKLEDIGGYNPLYVALNKTDIAKFKDPRLFVTEPKPSKPRPTRAPSCKKKKRQGAAADEEQDHPLKSSVKSSANNEQEQLFNKRNQIKRGVGIIQCWSKGTPVDGSGNQLSHMCSECHVVTQLADNVVPRYINEAVCKDRVKLPPGQASEDNNCVAGVGICAQKVIRFPALKRIGYIRNRGLSNRLGKEIYVEKWVKFTKEIYASCQCQIHSHMLDS